MTPEHLIVEVRGDGPHRTGLITLNRPKALNALNDALMDELGAALLAFDADDGIGCIVVTGSAKAFAAGADISAMAKLEYREVVLNGFITRNWETMLRVRKPVIATSSSPPTARSSASPRSRSASSRAPVARSACRERWASPRPWTWC
jgi:enoyl-CoA hydratase